MNCFANDYSLSWQDGTNPYEGIRELLLSLSMRGIPLAVLSNKPHSFTKEICAALFPEIPFNIVLGNREGLPHKPDPAPALEISSQLCIDPTNCTIIGDSTMDLDTARNAGMKSIAVTWGYHDRERLHYADEIVENVAELSAFLLTYG
jgi:phosphoglycolate phosphatase